MLVEPSREYADDIWNDICDFDGESGCIAVLRVYVDASTREESGLLSVAGYMFESGRVRRFRQRWRDTFGQKPFSWADLIARSKQFVHLKRERHDVPEPAKDQEHLRLVAAGVSLVREYVIGGTIVSCWKQDVANHGPTWIKGFGHAYSVAGHMALAGMGDWAKRNRYGGRLKYIIEEGDEGYDQLGHLLNMASKTPEGKDLYQWGGHETAPKTAFSPFHAPDLLAWEWGKYMTETALERKRPIRLSLVNLLVDRLDNYKFQHLAGPSLMRFFNQIHELGVEQLQENASAHASVEAMDVTAEVNASAQTARGTGQS